MAEYGQDWTAGSAPNWVSTYDPSRWWSEETVKPILNLNLFRLAVLLFAIVWLSRLCENKRSILGLGLIAFRGAIDYTKLAQLAERYLFVPGFVPIPWVSIVNVLLVLYCGSVICREFFRAPIMSANSFALWLIIYLNLEIIIKYGILGQSLNSICVSCVHGAYWTGEMDVMQILMTFQSVVFEFHMYSLYCMFWMVSIAETLRVDHPEKTTKTKLHIRLAIFAIWLVTLVSGCWYFSPAMNAYYRIVNFVYVLSLCWLLTKV